MHPISLYDAAVRDHRRAEVERARRQQVAIRRHERSSTPQGSTTAQPSKAVGMTTLLRASTRRPTRARGAATGVPARRPAADVRSAAGPVCVQAALTPA
ncbi:hypothetical protein GXB85_11715 [Cellulomonas sp. APG4]|uniref:hypothetical protein n=1 Tax=Cellulomonas sp. APG4 TaxID=1538656 RepID=UPI00137A396E|nr:hypothetical protein [Cellulomonas sp. APG4]NCT91612.1 hypothetical protein [Cellulomonas sp. APG4]